MTQLVTRAIEMSGAFTNHGVAPHHVGTETVIKQRCQLMYDKVTLFINFIYQKDREGDFIYLRGNAQIPSGVWTPWGSSGKSKLTRLERTVLRVWLLSKNTRRPPRPVFFYLDETRRWYVDTLVYASVDEAISWWNSNRISSTAFTNIIADMVG